MTRHEERQQASSTEKPTERNVSQSTASNWTQFTMLWVASGMGYFAYWAMQFALPLFAHQITTSPLVVSGITFVRTAPYLLFGLLAGALVDRYDRRFMLLLVTLLRLVAFCLATLVALLGYVTLPLLYAIALLLGITQTVEEPALAAAVPMYLSSSTWREATYSRRSFGRHTLFVEDARVTHAWSDGCGYQWLLERISRTSRSLCCCPWANGFDGGWLWTIDDL